MKNIFIILAASMLIFSASSAMACGDNDPNCEYQGEVSANGEHNAFAGTMDSASDFTYNDGAYAIGGSMGASHNEGSAWAENWSKRDSMAFELGEASADSHTGAIAGAADFGTMSMSGAAVGTHSEAEANGVSGFTGTRKGGSYDLSGAVIGGGVEQGNYANEVGYGSGTFAAGGNESGANYVGMDFDIDGDFDRNNGCGKVHGITGSEVAIEGNAFTAGGTVVGVDPYGREQSSFGITGNMAMADVDGTRYQDTNVYGTGEMHTGAFSDGRNANAGAYSDGEFAYEGSSFGMGATGSMSTAETWTDNGVNHASSSTVGGSFSTVGGSNGNGGSPE